MTATCAPNTQSLTELGGYTELSGIRAHSLEVKILPAACNPEEGTMLHRRGACGCLDPVQFHGDQVKGNNFRPRVIFREDKA